MSAIPAGFSSDGTPLTGVEASVLQAVDNWSVVNSVWYKYTNALKGGLIFGAIILITGVFFGMFAIITAMIVLIICGVLLLLANPEPVDVSPISATAHGVVNWNGDKHILTQNPQYTMNLQIRIGIPSRTPHSTQLNISDDPVMRGFDASEDLSHSMALSLINEDTSSVEAVRNSPFHPANIMIADPNKANLNQTIIPGFENISVFEDIQGIAIDFDEGIRQETQSNLDWISETIVHNSSTISMMIEQMQIDRVPYENWANQLFERGMLLKSFAFDSTIIGWNNARVGLDKAERALENSVAADIIAQEESVKREIEQAESRVREKSADFQLQIAEEREKLERRVVEIGGMITAQSRVVNSLNQMDVPSSLTHITKYGITSGGGGTAGGSVAGVYTTVETDTYEVRNPAFDTILGLITLAQGDLERYNQMKGSVSDEIGQLSSAHERMLENLREQQEERLEELDKAKERAINAIRKDSRQVRSIELQSYEKGSTPWDKLDIAVGKIWLQPYSIVNRLVESHVELTNLATEIGEIIGTECSVIDKMLQNKLYNGVIGERVFHHWVLLNGIAHSEILPITQIDFSGVHSVQIEVGGTSDILGIGDFPLPPLHLSQTMITNALARLFSLDLISKEVQKALVSTKEIQLIGGI